MNKYPSEGLSLYVFSGCWERSQRFTADCPAWRLPVT